MASVRALNESDSTAFSRSWREYFCCCFKRTSQSGAGLRGTNLSTSRSSTAIVDYGSRRTEFVQVISRSAADDDDTGWNEPEAGIRPVRTLSENDSTAFSACTGVKLITTTPEGQTVEADISSCSSSNSLRPLVRSEEGTRGESFNHVRNDKDSLNSTLDGRTITNRKEAEERGVEEEHQTSALPSEVSAVSQDSALSPRCHASLDFKRGVSEQSTSDSHLFDVSDLQLDRSSSVSSCGSIRLTLAYNETRELMNVTVHEAHDIPSQERGGASQTQVRMLLLPARKIRQKTKVKTGEHPQFEETFDFKVPRENLSDMGLRIRLYGSERFRRECLIGETIFAFSSVSTVDSSPQTTSIVLEPRSSLSLSESVSDLSSLAQSESGSSTQSLQHGGTPELMIGLAYNAATGRLSVEVIKGNNFRNMATKRLLDTYVKMTLTAPNGQEMTCSKTSVRRSQPNPLFKEMFVFQVAQFQLSDVSLLVSVFAQRSLKRKEMIGWFSLGNTSSSEEEQSHWSAMLSSKGEQVCRWHTLLEP